MRATNVEVERLKGIDQRIPAPKATAALMENWRSDWETGGWTNRLGYEKLLTSTSTFAPFVTFGRIDSVFCWAERSAALRWMLFETGGVLYFVNYIRDAAVTLESGRRRHALGEPGTNYVATQAGVVIANGGRIKRFNGWMLDLNATTPPLGSRYVNHGYETLPEPPRAYSVQSAGTGNPEFTTDLDGAYVTNAVGSLTQDVGLGSRNDGDENEYTWRVSWVDQTGSESALSAASNTVRWTTGTDELGKIAAVEIPTGPLGTVARRVYRTGYTDGLFRFVGEVGNNVETLFYDNNPDTRLGGEAPESLTPIPSPGARFVAQAANCLFIDGGPANGMAVFYSMPGTIAQFAIEDYIYLGGNGGDVTGLAGYYNAVIVFRERQVDVITGVYPDFRVAPLLLDAGGRAPATTIPVPGHGIMFLADDGVYALTGGLDGGSEAKVEMVSAPVQDYINRINPSVSPASKAVLCRKWKEYQLWVPIDGSPDLNIGLIYHYDREEWTVRTGWPVACVTSTPDGDVVFGHQTGANGSNSLESGLFVMSEARQMGYTKKGEQFVSADPPDSVYLSRLEALNDSADKKHLRYVYVKQMTTGSNTTAIQAEGDRGLVVNVGPALASQPADRELLPVYQSGIGAEVASWDDAKWSQPVPVDVRYSLVLDGSGYMQFRMTTDNDITLTGYTLGVVTSTTEVIEGRAATTRRPT
jgi:hypothetical protein